MATFTRKHVLLAATFGGLVFFSAVFAKQASAPSSIEPTKEEIKSLFKRFRQRPRLFFGDRH
jgi:hypothetical protein